MSSTSSKYFTVCQPLAEYSYQCQEQNPNNKSLCQGNYILLIFL